MFHVDVRSKIDLARILVAVSGVLFLDIFWMKDILFVNRWDVDIEYTTTVCHTAMLLVVLANLRFNRSSLWLMVALLVLAFEFLALFNCLESVLVLLVDGIEPHFEVAQVILPNSTPQTTTPITHSRVALTFAPFPFVAFCVLFLSALRKERDFLLLSQAVLFAITAICLMQKHSIPCFYPIC